MGDLSFLNLVTAILGFATAIVLLFYSQVNVVINRLLGLGFMLFAYRSLSIFNLQESLVTNTFAMGTVSSFYYFLPPVFFLYFSKMMRDESSFTKRDRIHFIIPVLSVILLIYYLGANLAINNSFSLPVQRPGETDIYQIPFYIPLNFHIIFLCCFSIFYLIASWRAYFVNLRMRKNGHPQVVKMKGWVISLLLICSLLMTVLFLSAIMNWIFHIQPLALNISRLNIIRSCLLVFLFVRVLTKRDLLMGMPVIETSLPVAIKLAEEPEPVIEEKKEEEKPIHEPVLKVNGQVHYDHDGWVQTDLVPSGEARERNINMEQDKVSYYISCITAAFEDDPFTNPDFDMRILSNKLEIPQYHLEYVFRYYNRYTFSEFRNLKRVNHVIRNIENGLHLSYTIEALGQRAGFSSRSSFFRVFKTVTGKTPGQYIEVYAKQVSGDQKVV